MEVMINLFMHHSYLNLRFSMVKNRTNLMNFHLCLIKLLF